MFEAEDPTERPPVTAHVVLIELGKEAAKEAGWSLESAPAFCGGVLVGLEFQRLYPELAGGLRRSSEVEHEAMASVLLAAGVELSNERLVVLMSHVLATAWKAVVTK